MAGPKKSLRFRAGEVGFAFYEESSGFPGMVIETTTFAFSTIGEAANWLKERFGNPTASPDAPRASASDQQDQYDRKYRDAESALMGRRWTEGEARRLKDLVSIGKAAAIRDTA